jgi:hypothetical protein
MISCVGAIYPMAGVYQMGNKWRNKKSITPIRLVVNFTFY